MNVKTYENDQIDLARKSIFLAGPTPRSTEVKSWRPQALEILEQLEFDGDVFVPEFGSGKHGDLEYAHIIDWELEHLGKATVVCFWIPRNLDTMPAFTTNVEFGYHLQNGNVVYGRPNDAPKNRYLDYLYQKHYQTAPQTTLFDTLQTCVKNVKQK